MSKQQDRDLNGSLYLQVERFELASDIEREKCALVCEEYAEGLEQDRDGLFEMGLDELAGLRTAQINVLKHIAGRIRRRLINEAYAKSLKEENEKT